MQTYCHVMHLSHTEVLGTVCSELAQWLTHCGACLKSVCNSLPMHKLVIGYRDELVPGRVVVD